MHCLWKFTQMRETVPESFVPLLKLLFYPASHCMVARTVLEFRKFDKNFNDIANDDDSKQQNRLSSPNSIAGSPYQSSLLASIVIILFSDTTCTEREAANADVLIRPSENRIMTNSPFELSTNIPHYKFQVNSILFSVRSFEIHFR